MRQNTVQDKEQEGWLRFFGFWPRLALLVIGCIALIIFTSWIWHGDWPQKQRQVLTQFALRTSKNIGFSIEDVTVEGRHYTSKQDILQALQVRYGSPIYAFDTHSAHDRVMKLPWVKSVSILRSLPDRILVRIEERQPVARWKNGPKIVVIDTEGNPIDTALVAEFPTLPLIVGDVKSEQTEKLISILHEFPSIAQRVKAAVRIAGRRWDLHLHPSIVVRLPQKEAHSAMIRLEELFKEQTIAHSNLDVKTIDLRLREKVFIEPKDPQNNGEQ